MLQIKQNDVGKCAGMSRGILDRAKRIVKLAPDDSEPCADAATRAATLVKAVSAIEQSEMGGWLKIAASHQATSTPNDAPRTQPQA